MNLYENIFRRKSNRKFSQEKLSDDVIKKIRSFMTGIPITDKDICLNAHLIIDGEHLYEKLNIIGRVQAPHYVVITGIRNPKSLINAGFAMEYLVLYLTSIGISTCYIGMKPDTTKLAKLLDIKNDEESLIILALGDSSVPSEVYRKTESFKRHTLKDLILSGYQTSDVNQILEAARLSPSAQNTQPWRFKTENKEISIYKKRLDFISRKLIKDLSYVDIGICLCHIKLAAENLKYKVEIIRKETELQNGENQDNKYILSVNLIKK